MDDQPILAFDCAVAGASVALQVHGHTHTKQVEQHQQAALLVPIIDDLMRQHSVAYRNLGAIVTTTGPGSFTGVRIGLAALHGLVLVTGTPIKLLTTLEAIAWQITNQPDAPQHFITALRAGKGEIYTQHFARNGEIPKPDSEITLLPETTSTWDFPCFGNAMEASSPQYIAAPNAALMTAIAHYLPNKTAAEAVPLYIRPPDAIAATPRT